ncbi:MULTISPECIES: flavodoxin family protein [Sporomusa]|jgi:multimeric flavodoxin WrbA|uniref:flavodoxin family protein n=1 Tax=Sporomusa TaxID=2375 RepID=UPI00315992F8
MNIVLINGSPRPKGTSALLSDEFIKGATAKGHCINVFNAAKEELHPCIACDKCRTAANGCVFKDGMEKLNPLLLSADMVVFVTPLYYFGMSSQIKIAIDRFYANNSALRAQPKKFAVLATCGDQEDWTFDALKLHYESLGKYLNWELIGSVYAEGVYVREDIENSSYPERAYEFGSSL